MNLKSRKENAQSEIKHQQELASNGENFSPVTVAECKRIIEIIDYIVPQISKEEWSRINAGVKGIDRDMSDCKDIKEKYELSWNELKMLRDSEVGTSESQKKASAKYDASNTKQIKLKLNTKTDADVINKLESVANKQGYIKNLIRRDIDG